MNEKTSETSKQDNKQKKELKTRDGDEKYENENGWPSNTKIFLGIPLPILLLGFTSLFTDLSSDMIQAVLPEFVITILGSGYIALGLIYGITDATANIIKGVSGWLSYRLKHRKKLILAGYSLSNLVAKPLIGFQTDPIPVLFLKAGDRIGKGIRTSPRDALIGYYSRQKSGRAFGIHRAMDTTGAIIGPLLGGLLIFLSFTINQVIIFSIVPGFIAIIFIFFVSDVKQRKKVGNRKNTEKKDEGKINREKINKNLLKTISVLAMVEFASLNTGFLIARTGNFIPVQWVTLLYALLNVIYAIVSIYAGRLSDSIGRKKIIITGLIILIITSTILALPFGSQNMTMIVIIIASFIMFGVYLGIVDPTSRAMVSDLSKTKKGKSYGLYYLLVGLLSIPETVIFGLIWEFYGATPAFLYSAFVLIACALIFGFGIKETIH